MMTLGKALEIEADESQRGSYWLVLSKKRSTDIVGGELCLGFEVAVLDPQQYHQVGTHLAGSKLWWRQIACSCQRSCRRAVQR
jgi:hypothetical protein